MSFILGIVSLILYELVIVGAQKYNGVLRVDIISCNFAEVVH
jgi:K+ transporter